MTVGQRPGGCRTLPGLEREGGLGPLRLSVEVGALTAGLVKGMCPL